LRGQLPEESKRRPRPVRPNQFSTRGSRLHDFPGGAGRWIQRADGYEATIVTGEVFMESGEHTGALVGQMLLGSAAG